MEVKKAVTEFFTQIRKNNKYQPTDIELKHVDEVLKLLSVFGEAEQFAELVSSGTSKEHYQINNFDLF